MSLDVYLYGKKQIVECVCQCCENKHTREERPCLYTDNITHNLNKMAGEAGIYKHLWRPEEINIKKAGELVQPLTDGLALLESDPSRFVQFNAPNGWGTYNHFVPFVRNYLEACKQNPEAEIEISR